MVFYWKSYSNNYDTDDSVEDLLSSTDEEDTNKWSYDIKCGGHYNIKMYIVLMFPSPCNAPNTRVLRCRLDS